MGKRKKRVWGGITDFLAYAVIRLVVMMFQMLSLRHAYGAADGLAWVLYRLDGRHRRVGVENLEKARGFGEMSGPAREALVLGVYRHFCYVLMEMMLMGRKIRLNTWRRMIRAENHAGLVDHLLRRRAVIVLTGHYGNWEMASVLLGAFGFSGHAVARVLDNPYLEAYLKRFRRRTGQNLIPKNGGYELMVQALEKGEMLLIVGDQDAGQNGLYVDFFGRPASSHKAVALLALEHDAPIFVSYARRVIHTDGRVGFDVGIETVLDPKTFRQEAIDNGGDEVKAMTQAFSSALERIVLVDPSQYFWLHRRWKHQPQPRVRRGAKAKVKVNADADADADAAEAPTS